MFVARCPRCATELDVDDADRGHRVACPACRTAFRAEPQPPPEPPPEPEPKPAVTAARRAPAARKWDDDSEYVNDAAVPPRHWIDREDDRGPDPLRVVRRELAWPANGLIWTGWLGFLVLIVGGVLTTVSGYYDMNSPYARGIGPILRLAAGAVAATLGSMYFIVIASGGGQMKLVRKRGQAMTTAVLGVGTLFTCGIPGAGVLLGGVSIGAVIVTLLAMLLVLPAVGFGIWALAVLNRPEVVEAFARRKSKAKPR